ncbi:MAG: glycosyltransferase family 2 protein [Xanthobacteraceae bacterium]
MQPDTGRPMQSSGLQPHPAPTGSVAILLCTYNGARFLPLQLASYEAQDFPHWRLFVSDDGSQDSTLSLLEDFQRKHGATRVTIRQGPRQGFVANFLSLICDPTVNSDYYALSDQDDVWDPHKLVRAHTFLGNAPGDQPVVYCSRTRLIDEHGIEIGLSPLFRRPPDFRNALMQSIAGGNTMVFNERTHQLLMQAGPDVQAASHDWWIYMIISAVGGIVFYDSVPSISYRVHARNVIGSNRSVAAQMLRARMLWHGRFKSWADMNVRALEHVEAIMTDDNKKTFDLFRQCRKLSLVPRVRGLIRSGIHRQTLLGNIGLAAAMLVGKI